MRSLFNGEDHRLIFLKKLHVLNHGNPDMKCYVDEVEYEENVNTFDDIKKASNYMIAIICVFIMKIYKQKMLV